MKKKSTPKFNIKMSFFNDYKYYLHKGKRLKYKKEEENITRNKMKSFLW